jgi:hypothetical protein
MKISFKTAFKLVVLNAFALIFGAMALNAHGNGDKPNQMDKIEQFKKMKMLDYLNLS